MTNKEPDVTLTVQQVEKIISDLVRRYGPDEMLPIGELNFFLRDKYVAER